jgi:LPS export ABC transporter protein LptC
MEVIERKRKISAVDLRARVPAIARGFALFLFIAGTIFVGVSYYKMRNRTQFRLSPGAPALSKEVTGIINGYEQRITKDNRLYLWLRAARDVTYADGHHELEQVNLQVFQASADKPDQIVSDRSLYDQKNGLLQFNGNVQVETHDALKLKTDDLLYRMEPKVGETSSPIAFERENVSGKAVGALVDNTSKRVELRNDVEITVAPDANDSNLKGSRAKPVIIHSRQAVFDRASMRLTFSGGATAEQDQDIMSGDTLT